MNAYNLKHLADDALLTRTSKLFARDRRMTARLLAHLAEIDSRKLFARLAYPSMYEYCIRVLGLSEDASYKRIQVARVAHQYPALFPAIADGRVHMGAVRLLAPYLSPLNAEDLITAATRKTCDEVRAMLAKRYPQAETLAFEGIAPPVREIVPPAAEPRVSPDPAPPKAELATWQVSGKPKPLSSQRFDLHITIGVAARDHLERARELSGKTVEDVLIGALALYVVHLEKQKYAATARPVGMPKPSNRSRTIPADVKRGVWRRDGGRCTFRSPDGRRCSARVHLEFDHVIPLAHGGKSVLENVRLLCRAHNQLEAERRLGKTFMEERRAQASRKPPKSSQAPAPV